MSVRVEHVVRCDDCQATARDTLGRSAGEVREALALAGWSADKLVDLCPRCTTRRAREEAATIIDLSFTGPGVILGRGGLTDGEA
jgi:hypothetical protein